MALGRKRFWPKGSTSPLDENRFPAAKSSMTSALKFSIVSVPAIRIFFRPPTPPSEIHDPPPLLPRSERRERGPCQAAPLADRRAARGRRPAGPPAPSPVRQPHSMDRGFRHGGPRLLSAHLGRNECPSAPPQSPGNRLRHRDAEDFREANRGSPAPDPVGTNRSEGETSSTGKSFNELRVSSEASY